MHQSIPDLEIIAIDDGSTDNSLKILKDLASKDTRIKIYHQSNLGVSAARNSGIEKACGEYISFVDADDYLSHHFAEYLLNIANQYSADFIFSTEYYNCSKNQTPKTISIKEMSETESVAKLLSPNTTVGCWNKIYRLAFLKSNGLHFDETLSYGEGLKFIIDCASASKKTIACNKKLYFYRRNNSTSATTKYSPNNYLSGKKSLEQISKTVNLKNYEISKSYYVHLATFFLGALADAINNRESKQTINALKKQYAKTAKKALSYKEIDFYRRVLLIAGILFPNIIARLSQTRKVRRLNGKQSNPKTNFTILQIISVDNPLGNGVYHAVKNYTQYESQYADIAILDIKGTLKNEQNIFRYSEHKTIKSLPLNYSTPSIVVFNEIYNKEYISLYKECIKRNIPYVVIPHGSLKKEAQKSKKIKKNLANILLFDSFIKKSSAIQFLNNYEKNSSVIFPKTHIIIHGNGIDRTRVNHRFPENPVITYIGRYSIHTKGLDLLIEAFSHIKDYLISNNVKVQLYGRDTTDKSRDIENIINNYGLSKIISVNGPVFSTQKTEALKNSTLFIQTSRHEGQPMGIIEALSYGIPCIVTQETSFGTEVNIHKCGIGVNCDSNEISKAISTLLSKNVDLKEYSKNAIALVNKKYLWGGIARSTIRDYMKITQEDIYAL